MSQANEQNALPGSEEMSRYTITSVLEIAHHLRRIMQSRQPVTVFSNHGKSFIITRLLDVDPREKRLIFDVGSDIEANRHLLSSSRNVFVSSPDGVKTQFFVGSVFAVEFEGRRVFRCDLPAKLIKLQRREYFRIRTPQMHPVMCVIHDYDNGKGVSLPVYDVSLGGLALTSQKALPGFEVGVTFEDVALDLLQAGTIPVVLLIKNMLQIQRESGVYFRYGCEFQNLSLRGQATLQRYVAQLERDRLSID